MYSQAVIDGLYWQEMTTKRDIITLPHQNLRRRSKRVDLVTKDVRKIISDMQAATLDWEKGRKHEVGVALAAVQINKPVKIVIVRNNPDNKNQRGFGVFINPEITKYEGALETGFEGCLSITDIYGKVPRYSKIRVKAVGLDGQPVRIKADGFLARVLQHEIDHLNGKLFIDRIKNKPHAFYKLLRDGELKELEHEKDIKTSSILW